jgi:phosphoribosylformylglycinamidine synthase
MTNRVSVQVWLKGAVLDPQGQAVMKALQREGLADLSSVRQGKVFYLDFAEEVALGDSTQRQLIEKLAKELLSNPVIEDFQISWHDSNEDESSASGPPTVAPNALVVDVLEGDA